MSFCNLGWPATISPPILSILNHNLPQILFDHFLWICSTPKTDTFPHFSHDSPSFPLSMLSPSTHLGYLFSCSLAYFLTLLYISRSSISLISFSALLAWAPYGISLPLSLFLLSPASIGFGSSVLIVPTLSLPFYLCYLYHSHPHFSFFLSHSPAASRPYVTPPPSLRSPSPIRSFDLFDQPSVSQEAS